MKFLGITALGVLLAVVLFVPAMAQFSTPQAIRMQGYLSDKSTGTPLPASGTYTMQFDLYDALLGGGLVVGSGPLSVLVSNGLYEVELPFAANDFGGVERYVEISIDPDGVGPRPSEILSPRMRIVSAPFAYLAEKLDGLDSTAFALKLHTHAGGDITTGTVSQSVIDSAVARDAEIVPTVLANDGSGSGLDADQLDGLEATSFLAAGSAWSLSGNAGTVPGTHFIGTVDNQPLEMRVNGSPVGRFDTNGDVVLGYSGNSAAAAGGLATISGGGKAGYPNVVNGYGGTVSGGQGNTAANGAVVGGGAFNIARGQTDTISGGVYNETSGHGYGTVGGGAQNKAMNGWATVGGGDGNNASGIVSSICGGRNNVASGVYATVPGGQGNWAGGDWSFAAGRRAQASTGSFVWADSTDATIQSTTSNEFLVRASGGVIFYSDSTASTGVSLPAGGGAWSTVSDVNLKHAFYSPDPLDILTRLARLPVPAWSYTSQEPSVRHIGPTAQDFASVFGFGESDRFISTVDADGVALASIQGLYQIIQAKEREIDRLKSRLEELEARVSRLTKRP